MVYRIPRKVWFLECASRATERHLKMKNAPIPPMMLQFAMGEFIIRKTAADRDRIESKPFLHKIDPMPGSILDPETIETWGDAYKYAIEVYPEYLRTLREEMGDCTLPAVDRAIYENPKLSIQQIADLCRSKYGVHRDDAKDERIQKRRERLIKLWQEYHEYDLRQAVMANFLEERQTMCQVRFGRHQPYVITEPKEVRRLFTIEAWERHPIAERELYGTRVYALVCHAPGGQKVSIKPFEFDDPVPPAPLTKSKQREILHHIAVKPFELRQDTP